MSTSPQRWEIAALVLAVVGALLWRFLRPRVLAGLGGRVPPRFQQLWASPAADWLLVLACLLVAWLPLRASWALISPHRFLSGPDSEGYLGAAIALETGDWAMYPDDRYPGFPWLVSLLSPDLDSIAWTGTTVSMAAMVLCVVPLYWIGRQLAGRAAGVVGAVLGLRQILVVDIGQTFTSYPLVALLDATLVALGVAVVQARGWRALVPAAGFLAAGVLACTSDPKQIPLVVAMGGALGLVLLVRPGRPWAQRLLLLALVVAPLPVGHLSMAPFASSILTVESLVMRTPGSVQTEAFLAGRHEGFVLGKEGGLQQLAATLYAVQTQVSPDPGTNRQERLSLGLSLAWPRTSALWLGLVLAFPLLVLIRKPGAARVAGPLLVLVHLSAAVPLVRVYYAHRWALPTMVLLPVAAAGSTALLTGPLGVLGAGFAALLLSDSPMSRVDAHYLKTGSRQTDSWTMGEDQQLLSVLDRASAALPATTPVYDFCGSNPVTAFALRFPYTMCRTPKPGRDCKDLGSHRPLAAVLRLNDGVTAGLPGGPGGALAFGEGFPVAIGCWRYVDWLRHDAALYTWSCDDAPGSGGGPPVIVPADGSTGPPPRTRPQDGGVRPSQEGPPRR